ncbi:NAD(P)/FAD-dependent oxidoreductase [Kaistella sp.]|uniref:NAD(P)/FAD-dependent oxidoreductase n=1 Tax=Kaistella sp. TaxID=2782235 RepID=UPI003C5CF45A
MKNIDYIIVGDGYAAFFFAHQLILQKKSFVLFSANQKSASQVSAGIVNPLVLKKFTTFWMAAEQIEFLTKTMAEIESYTGKNYLIQERIHRIFHDENERQLWLMKSETDELKPFLNPDFESLGIIKNPFGTGEVNQSARLDVNGFFKDISTYLEEHEMLVKKKFDYTKIEGTTYEGFNFKNIVFCEGMGVRENPFFTNIQVIANKGHHLKVKLSVKLNHQYTLKKKHFLFPLNEDLYYYGGTYDPNERENEIDDFKTIELKDGLSEFYPHDFEIEEVNYGFRPTVKDRRPIIGNLPDHQNFYIFNGLGARGILNGCYFSKELYEHIENGNKLMPEVDLKRFNK